MGRAAKLEFSSENRSEFKDAGHNKRRVANEIKKFLSAGDVDADTRASLTELTSSILGALKAQMPEKRPATKEQKQQREKAEPA